MCVLLQEVTAADIILKINHFLQDSTQMKRKPAESKDEDQREDGFSHLTPLNTHIHM